MRNKQNLVLQALLNVIRQQSVVIDDWSDRDVHRYLNQLSVSYDLELQRYCIEGHLLILQALCSRGLTMAMIKSKNSHSYVGFVSIETAAAFIQSTSPGYLPSSQSSTHPVESKVLSVASSPLQQKSSSKKEVQPSQLKNHSQAQVLPGSSTTSSAQHIIQLNRTEKEQYTALQQLAEDFFDSKYNRLGIGFFSRKTPAHIEQVRRILDQYGIQKKDNNISISHGITSTEIVACLQAIQLVLEKALKRKPCTRNSTVQGLYEFRANKLALTLKVSSPESDQPMEVSPFVQ